MPRMTDDEVWAFLEAGAPTGKVATVRPDGRPHVAPIWYLVEDRTLLFNTGADTVKGRSLQRDPRVSLCVDDANPPFSFVTVEGRAEIVTDQAEILRTATLIGGRYMGAGRAQEFGTRNAAPGELLIRIVPTHLVGVANLAD